MAISSRIGLRPPRLSSYHVIVAVVSLALLALLVLLSYGVALRQGGTFAGFSVNTVGRDAPINVRPASDFELLLFDGETFQLSDYQGQVVVINFWSSWCPPCPQEAPALEATWRAVLAAVRGGLPVLAGGRSMGGRIASQERKGIHADRSASALSGAALVPQRHCTGGLGAPGRRPPSRKSAWRQTATP